jgi:N-acetylmuramoyl-L-alanine amidase
VRPRLNRTHAGMLQPGSARLMTSDAVSRRGFLLACAGVASGVVLTPDGEASAATASDGAVQVHPRDAWGSDLPVKGPLAVEAPGDVRFLLVHHSASSNAYERAAVAIQIRAFYKLHTSTKGWPDVAYNFLVDRFGGIWEGRAGSLTAPVRGDATGGSQGFALLCCFIGDHRDIPPSPEATGAMVRLLPWLAGQYCIDTSPGATTSFVSRGSTRWPAGSHVTTSTIAGHRDMSLTECPGNAAYALVRNCFPEEATRRR